MKASISPGIWLWMVGPSHARRLARVLRGEPFEWCYLGTDLTRKETVANILGASRQVGLAEELNRVASDTKRVFLDWVAEIGRRQTDQLNWWASRLASKSTLQTDCFLLVCYYRLIKSWLDGEMRDGARIAVVEDPWLRLLLQQDFRAVPGVEIRVSAFEVIGSATYWVARVPFAIAYVVLLESWRKLLAALLLPAPQKERNRGGSSKPEVLLYTWIEPSCFGSTGRLKDQYTGRLEDILKKKGETVRRLTSFTFEPHFLYEVKPFAQELVVTPRHITVLDILASALSLFSISGLREAAHFEGSDFTLLLYREILREWGSRNFCLCRLSFRAFRRVACLYGNGVKSLIYPFENQPWEKMLCLAFRAEAPWVRMIGYQHASVPALLLCYFLGKREADYVPLPDVVVTNGKATLRLLKDGGFPEEKLVDGGALRFEYLLERNARNRTPTNVSKKQYRVLVAFPTSFLHAASLLQGLREAFPRPSQGGDGAPGVSFTLKFHPDLPWEVVSSQTGPVPEWFGVSTAPLGTLLEEADLFLYSPPTGTWREAVLAGLPVIKYLGEFLDLDTAELPTGLEIPVCSRTTLRETVHVTLTGKSDPPREARRSFAERVFSPVNEEVWLELINQGGAGTSRACSAS